MLDILPFLAEAIGVGEYSNIDRQIEICRIIGMDAEAIRADLEAVLNERVVMWLIGEVDPDLNYNERRKILRNRLSGSLSANSDDAIEHLLHSVASHQANIATPGVRKVGISNIDEAFASDLLTTQGYRCAICGVPLRSRAQRTCSRFPDGLEPVVAADLDHVSPFYLAGNQGAHRLLCKFCNTVKNDRIGVQEDGFVLCGNHVRPREAREIRRRMAFWTLSRKPRCTTCPSTARDHMLLVVRDSSRAPWSYGNLRVVCTEDAPDEALWPHADALWAASSEPIAS